MPDEERYVPMTEDWFGQMRVRLDEILGRAPSRQTWNHARALIVLLDEAKAKWDAAPTGYERAWRNDPDGTDGKLWYRLVPEEPVRGAAS